MAPTVRFNSRAQPADASPGGGGDHPAEDRTTAAQYQRRRQFGVDDSDAARGSWVNVVKALVAAIHR